MNKRLLTLAPMDWMSALPPCMMILIQAHLGGSRHIPFPRPTHEPQRTD